jgi:hypothetical protein
MCHAVAPGLAERFVIVALTRRPREPWRASTPRRQRAARSTPPHLLVRDAPEQIRSNRAGFPAPDFDPTGRKEEERTTRGRSAVWRSFGPTSPRTSAGDTALRVVELDDEDAPVGELVACRCRAREGDPGYCWQQHAADTLRQSACSPTRSPFRPLPGRSPHAAFRRCDGGRGSLPAEPGLLRLIEGGRAAASRACRCTPP